MKSMDEKLMEPCRRPRHRAGDPWLVAPDHRGDTRDGFVAGIRASGGSAQRWWVLTAAKNEPVEVS